MERQLLSDVVALKWSRRKISSLPDWNSCGCGTEGSEVTPVIHSDSRTEEFRWKKIADTSRFLSLSPSYVLSLVLNYDEWFWGGLCLLQQALLSPSEYFLPSRWCVLSHFYQWLRVFTIQSNHCRVSSKFIPLAKSGIRCWFESLNVG